MFEENYKFSCVERFLEYAKIDTQSDEESATFPSDPKQLELSKKLVGELKDLGLEDAHMDANGYVIATLPSNTDKEVPVIGFLSHVDTSPAVSGKDVKPVIHKNYQGGDIVLPADNTKVIKASENPEMADMIGYDIITADGTTLLGADDKAGIAEIMDAVKYLVEHPEIKHGEIKIGFTPDEEVGRGAEKFDVEAFGAKFAYTIDGSTLGEVEAETFSADAVEIKFQGVNVHPGYAKNKLVNAAKVAARFLDKLPKETLSPETTEGREGFVHPTNINGNEDITTIKFIIRDFDDTKLPEYENLLKELAEKTIAEFPGATFEFKVTEQYRNMYNIIKDHMDVVENAYEACERLGLKIHKTAIRGGTDGSRLSYMGLPTPNLFAGGHNFHGYQEYIAIQDMQAAVKMIVELIKIWEEKA